MSKRFTSPFLHFAIPNFLSEAKYEQLKQAYSKLQFLEKESDLFHFFQTNELKDEPTVQFFKEELNREFGKLTDLTHASYNIFASYYFQGDYLLCHDDVVEDRRFAFSYYLEDHPSAELVLYDETATKAVKKISVTRNLLVIFEVSNISYHEVAYCTQDGRKAVTGWLNIPGHGATRETKKIDEFKPHIPADLLKYPLEENLEEEEFYQFPEIEYCFDAESTAPAGPLYERKATRLELENNVVFELKGYELISADFFKFDKGDYVLLNDPVNSLGDNVLDVFIVQLPKKGKNSEESCIQIVDEKGNASGIPYINNSVFIVHRNNRNYFIDRVDKQFFLGHLIYRKIVKGKEKKKGSRTKGQVMSIRKKLMNHYQEEKEEGEGKIVPENLQKSKPIKKPKEDPMPKKQKKKPKN